MLDCQCNSCWVPHQSRKCSFLGYFWRFLANLGHFCGRGALLWSGDTILSPTRLNKYCLKKKKIQDTQITSCGLAHRKVDNFWPICDVFWPILTNVVAREVNRWLTDTIQNHRVIIQDYLMIKESLMTHETHVDASQRAFFSVLWLFFEFLAPF